MTATAFVVTYNFGNETTDGAQTRRNGFISQVERGNYQYYEDNRENSKSKNDNKVHRYKKYNINMMITFFAK